MFGTRCRIKMFNRLSCFPGFILRPWCNCLASLLPVVVVFFFKIGPTGPSSGSANVVEPRLTTTLFIQPPRYYDPILSTQM